MAARKLLLTTKAARLWRRDLIHFLDALGLFLAAGFDVSYAWPTALELLRPRLHPTLAHLLTGRPGEGLGEILARGEREYPLSAHRLWFGIIHHLYAEGAGMTHAVSALGRTLRHEQQRELENYARALPLRSNLVLLLFFLPSTLLLLFAPLVMQALGGF